jgi:hypothetical protein
MSGRAQPGLHAHADSLVAGGTHVARAATASVPWWARMPRNTRPQSLCVLRRLCGPLLFSLWLAACAGGDETGAPDAGTAATDAAAGSDVAGDSADAAGEGVADAEVRLDGQAGDNVDDAALDGDAGAPAPQEAGASDAGDVDAAVTGAGIPDAARPDVGVPDAGVSDAGSDAGATDAGSDAGVSQGVVGAWRWQNPLPQGNDLLGAFARTNADVWLVGSFGTILHFDGATLTSVPSPTTRTLRAVWASSASDVWVVGDAGTLLRLKNGEFEALSVSSADLRGVFGFGPDDVWLVGALGTLRHWDGTSWSGAPSIDVGTGSLLSTVYDAVWGSGPSDVWAVGNAGDIVHWDGVRFVLVPSGTRAPLNAIHGAGAGST